MKATLLALLRPRWLLTVMASLAFACVLFAHGLVNAEFGADGNAAPSGHATTVPQDVRTGGPIIGAGEKRWQFRIPDRTVILTFDDGPDPSGRRRSSTCCRHTGARHVLRRRLPGRPRTPSSSGGSSPTGHEIGLHTFTHPDLSTVPALAARHGAVADPAGDRGRRRQSRPRCCGRPTPSHAGRARRQRTWPVAAGRGEQGYLTVLSDAGQPGLAAPRRRRDRRQRHPAGGQGAVVLMHDAGGDRAQTVAGAGPADPAAAGAGLPLRTTVAEAVGASRANTAGDRRATSATAAGLMVGLVRRRGRHRLRPGRCSC